MKSITKCPHCETQFYVDDAQLSQYNGKVRCGNCLEVFVAADYFIHKDDSKTAAVSAPTREAAEEAIIDNAAVDNAVDEAASVEEDTSDPAASFVFKHSASVDVEENIDDSDSTEDEHDGIASTRDVDENFIAKTESLIKNINIEDVAAKLEPEVKSTSMDGVASQGESRKNVLKDDPDEVVFDQPGFSFEIDSPDTLDVLSKWRDNAEKESELTLKSTESSIVIEETIEGDNASIAEPPTPMTDEFVLPEPSQTASDSNSSSDEQTSENYDFLLTQKEPFSPWMMALAVLLVVLLVGQGVYYFRNQLARAIPELKPVLQQLCVPIGCEISLPKEINLLSIDDSRIQQDAKLQGVIRLSSTITNRAKFSQAYPKLEVTLTDERDMPKVRRVFAPIDYLNKDVNLAEGVQAGESIPVEMALMTDAENISGFRILLAY